MVDVGPRLVIRRARWKTAILLAPHLPLAAVFVFLLAMPEPLVRLVGIVSLPLLLIVSVVLTMRLVRPDRLVLTTAGFHIEGDMPLRASRPILWAEVTEFQLRYNLYRNRAWIGWRRRGSRLSNSALLTFLFPNVLEGGWTLPPEGLVRVLEEWRIRYSTAPL